MEPSEQIDQLIEAITDWRGKVFAEARKIILESDPGIIEEFKWMGSPLWSCAGMIAVGNAHKGKVKLTFAYGAHLPDPDRLFNAGLEGNARRAIDLFEAIRSTHRRSRRWCAPRSITIEAISRRTRSQEVKIPPPTESIRPRASDRTPC